MALPSLLDLLAIPLDLRVDLISRHVNLGEIQTRKPNPDPIFLAIRDYRFGDPLRSLDFRSSARRNRWLVREWERHSTLNLELWLDTTASMQYAPTLPKGEVMKIFAGIIGIKALARNHRLRIRCLCREGIYTFQSPLKIPHLFNFLETLEFQGSWSFQEYTPSFPADLIIFISDFMDREISSFLLSFFEGVDHSRRELRLLQILHPDEVSFDFEDERYFLFHHLEDPDVKYRLQPCEVRAEYHKKTRRHWEEIRNLAFRFKAAFMSWTIREDQWIHPLRFLFWG